MVIYRLYSRVYVLCTQGIAHVLN